MYKSDLESDLVNEETGPLGRLFRSLATGGRQTNTQADINLAQKDAQNIYDVI